MAISESIIEKKIISTYNRKTIKIESRILVTEEKIGENTLKRYGYITMNIPTIVNKQEEQEVLALSQIDQ